MKSGRSLINSKNSDGPRTEPCGTPALMRRMDEEWPSCTTEIWRSLRKLESKFSNSPEMPYDFNLWMSPLCQTLSKTFEMSRATSRASPRWSNALFMCSVIRGRISPVDRELNISQELMFFEIIYELLVNQASKNLTHNGKKAYGSIIGGIWFCSQAFKHRNNRGQLPIRWKHRVCQAKVIHFREDRV